MCRAGGARNTHQQRRGRAVDDIKATEDERAHEEERCVLRAVRNRNGRRRDAGDDNVKPCLHPTEKVPSGDPRADGGEMQTPRPRALFGMSSRRCKSHDREAGFAGKSASRSSGRAAVFANPVVDDGEHHHRLGGLSEPKVAGREECDAGESGLRCRAIRRTMVRPGIRRKRVPQTRRVGARPRRSRAAVFHRALALESEVPAGRAVS